MTGESYHVPSGSLRGVRRIVFIVEMLLSPVVAGMALLAPAATLWGTYGYIPAIVWVALLIQSLFTFDGADSGFSSAFP